MPQHELYEQIARATGDELSTITAHGFQTLEPDTWILDPRTLELHATIDLDRLAA